MNSSSINSKKIRIIFLIRSLFFGGAERQLLTLVRGMDKSLFEPIVIRFYRGGELEEEFVKSGAVVISLGKTQRWDVFPFFIRLMKEIKVLKPDILHGYLNMSNILVALLKILYPTQKIVFGVRFAFMDLSKYDWLTRLVYRLEIILSRFADLIIVNSYSGKRNHTKSGYASNRMIVIPNGIDTARFCPAPQERAKMRQGLGIDSQTLLVGLVGRLDPIKDHPTFIRAAAKVTKGKNHIKFICIGDGDPKYRAELKEIAHGLEVSENIIWLNGQKNVRAVYNALDIFCSASIGESFSNVIAEAMACGLPCVVTDVGDSAVIVGQYGVAVPAGDADALAKGMEQILALPVSDRQLLGARSRQRIEENFNMERMIRRTESTLINLTKGIITE